MTNESIENINRVTDILTNVSTDVLSSYTAWHLTSAVGFLILGLVLIATGAGVAFWAHKHKFADYEDYTILGLLGGGSIILVGVLMVVANISTVISPDAYAIHQLIRDIRG